MTDITEKSEESTLIYSEIEQIQTLIKKALLEINRAGIMVYLKQMIPYGTQLLLEGQGENGLITIYYSRKKGFSFVDNSGNDTSKKAIVLLRENSIDIPGITKEKIDPRETAMKRWIGTDESGKGDFFGPLVIAGFYITREIEKDIIHLGVTDSKKLSSRQVKSIADSLHKNYAKHISIVAPSNRKYNELYEKFKNLNRFLAWGHARVIENLIDVWGSEKDDTPDGAVSDQFGNETYIRNALSSMKHFNLIQRPRAESNTAVAAASILARDTFEKKIDSLQERYTIKLPFGAGPQVVSAAKKFTQRYGKERIAEIAKVHFKTIRQI